MADSTHEACRDAAVVKLESLSLGIFSGKVRKRLAIDENWERNLGNPFCLVSPVGIESEYPTLTLSGKDAWALPITIRLGCRSDRDGDEFTAELLRLRQLIKRAFHHKARETPFSTLTGLADILWQPTALLEAAMIDYQLLCSPILLNFITQEVRT